MQKIKTIFCSLILNFYEAFMLAFGEPGFLAHEFKHGLFDSYEHEIAIKFKNGNFVSLNKDEYSVDKMVSIGEMNFGLSRDFRPTAKLTVSGRQMLIRDTVSKNPVANFFARIWASTY